MSLLLLFNQGAIPNVYTRTLAESLHPVPVPGQRLGFSHPVKLVQQTSSLINYLDTAQPYSATLPSAPTVGNLLVLIVASVDFSINPLSGWTGSTSGGNDFGNAGSSITTLVYRYVNAGDTATIPVFGTFGNGTQLLGQLFEFSNADAASITVHGGDGSFSNSWDMNVFHDVKPGAFGLNVYTAMGATSSISPSYSSNNGWSNGSETLGSSTGSQIFSTFPAMTTSSQQVITQGNPPSDSYWSAMAIALNPLVYTTSMTWPYSPTDSLSTSDSIAKLLRSQRFNTEGVQLDPRLLGTPLAAWYDAADATTITQSSGTVSAWVDKSGNSNTLSQFTSGNQPSVSSLNGLPVFTTTGSHSLTTTTATNLPQGSSAWSIFYVGYTTSNVGFNRYAALGWGTGGQSVSSIYQYNNGTDAGLGIQSIDTVGSQYGYYADNNGNLVTAPYVISQTYSGSGASLTTGFAQWVNGNSSGLGYQISSVPNISGTSLTLLADTAGNPTWQGYLGEVVIFAGALGTTARQKMEGYLAWKWGLQAQLPTGHPYLSAPPIAPVGSGFTQSTSQQSLLNRAASNTQTTSDSVARLITAIRSNTDTSNFSDSDADTLSLIRTLTDTTTTNDSNSYFTISGAITRAFTETFTTSDTLSFFRTVVRNIPQTSTTSDSLASMNAFLRSMLDTLTTSDSIAYHNILARTLNDSLTTADALLFYKTLLKSLSDTMPATSATLAQNNVFSRLISDSVTTSDSLARVLHYLRIVGDTVTTSDSIARALFTFRALTDSTTLSTSIQIARAYNLSDTATTTDNVLLAQSLHRVAADTFATSDSASRLTSYNRAAADTVTTSDNLVRFVLLVRALADTSTFGDSANRLLHYFRAETDSTSTSDSLAAFKTFMRIASETHVTSDTVNRQVEIIRLLTETMPSFSDLPSTNQFIIVQFLEMLLGNQTLQSQMTAPRSVEDDTVTTDGGFTSGQSLFRGLIDTFLTNDQSKLQFPLRNGDIVKFIHNGITGEGIIVNVFYNQIDNIWTYMVAATTCNNWNGLNANNNQFIASIGELQLLKPKVRPLPKSALPAIGTFHELIFVNQTPRNGDRVSFAIGSVTGEAIIVEKLYNNATPPQYLLGVTACNNWGMLGSNNQIIATWSPVVATPVRTPDHVLFTNLINSTKGVDLMGKSYLELTSAQLISFANGTAINGFSVAASPTTVSDNGTALTYLDTQLWSIASAYTVNGTVEFLIVNEASASYRIATITTAGIHNFPATVLVGYKNNSETDQDVNLVCIIYDNPSVPSGVVLDSIAAPDASSVTTYPAPGLPVASGGITVVVTLTVPMTGNGIQILYY